MEAEVKTDAAVLFDLIGEMQKAFPASDTATYTMLSKFNRSNSADFNVMKLVHDCCGRLRSFVDLIPEASETHKSAFQSAIKNFENQFDLRNLGATWKQFLEQLSNPMHVQALHFLDYMIQAQPFWRLRKINVVDAEALLTELEEAIGKLPLPDYLVRTLNNDIAKLRFILKNYERFGEQDYWEKFQNVTGLFGSLYTTLDDDARRQANPILNKLIGRVTAGMAFSADALQIASAVSGFLPKA